MLVYLNFKYLNLKLGKILIIILDML